MKKVASIVAALTLSVGILTGASAKETTVEISLFKMYDTTEGTYLLDPSSDYENVIFVDKEQAIKWGVYKIHHGTKVIGVFDETGWELSDIKN